MVDGLLNEAPPFSGSSFPNTKHPCRASTVSHLLPRPGSIGLSGPVRKPFEPSRTGYFQGACRQRFPAILILPRGARMAWDNISRWFELQAAEHLAWAELAPFDGLPQEQLAHPIICPGTVWRRRYQFPEPSNDPPGPCPTPRIKPRYWPPWRGIPARSPIAALARSPRPEKANAQVA